MRLKSGKNLAQIIEFSLRHWDLEEALRGLLIPQRLLQTFAQLSSQ